MDKEKWTQEDEKAFEERVRKDQKEKELLAQALKKKMMEKKLTTIRKEVSKKKLLYGLLEKGMKMEPKNPGQDIFDGASAIHGQLKLYKKKTSRLEK